MIRKQHDYWIEGGKQLDMPRQEEILMPTLSLYLIIKV